MSSPYIQVELDALKKATLLACALGIHLREAVGGLALMWAHVYTSKAEAVTAFYLRAFFGVDGAAEALVELGFIDPHNGAWRVRGAGRYTRLSAVRSDAGRKGAKVSNERQASKRAAKDQQTEAQESQDVASDSVSKRAAIAATRTANDQQASPKRQQKAALEPIADSSLPTGERTSGRGVTSSSRAEAGPPPPGAGTAAHGVQVRSKPEKPPRPKLIEGTPEYREAVAMGDYEALQWGPYAPKAVQL